MAKEKKVLLERHDLGRTISRMAHEIVEKATTPNDIVLIGIRSRGVHLARRLASSMLARSATTDRKTKARRPSALLSIQLRSMRKLLSLSTT